MLPSQGRVSLQVLALWLDLFRDGGLDRALEAGSAAGQMALFHLTRHVFSDAADAPRAQLSLLCLRVLSCRAVLARAQDGQLQAIVGSRLRPSPSLRGVVCQNNN